MPCGINSISSYSGRIFMPLGSWLNDACVSRAAHSDSAFERCTTPNFVRLQLDNETSAGHAVWTTGGPRDAPCVHRLTATYLV